MTPCLDPTPPRRCRRVRSRRAAALGRCAVLLGALAAASVASAARVVSRVDASLSQYEKPVLLVDGRPFFFNGIQIRADKLRDRLGWSDAQIEAAFALAAEAGFTVVNVPLLWSDVEPARDRFDWTTLERYIGWAARHGLKLELLWFGTNSGGELQTRDGAPQGPLRAPGYVLEFARVLDREGRPLTRNGLFQLDWSDPALRRRETEVLAEVMRRIAAHDERHGRPRVVVGLQIENEPQIGKMQGKRMTERSHGPHAEAAFAAGGWSDAKAFTLDVMFRYIDAVAGAVKRSDYSVWTRVNCWSKTTHAQPLIGHIEAARADGGNIDFEGPDTYESDPARLVAALDRWRTPGNFLMVMENSGTYANAATLPIVALSTGAAYNVYDLCSTDNHGMFVPQDGRAVPRGPQTAAIGAVNRLLRRAWFDLATCRQGGSGSLQTFNAFAAAQSATEHALAGVTVRYATDAAGQGIAIRRGAGEWLLLSTQAATFTLRGLGAVEAATAGGLDAENRWRADSPHPWSRADDAVVVTMPIGNVVRLIAAPR